MYVYVCMSVYSIWHSVPEPDQDRTRVNIIKLKSINHLDNIINIQREEFYSRLLPVAVI